MIKAVVFDLDGVYFENGTQKFINSLKSQFGMDEEKIKDVYLRSYQMQDYKKGKISKEEFWNYAIKEWNINSTPDELIKMLIDGYEINPETAELVRNVRGSGIKTAICTNNFPERLNGLDEKFSFKKDFDVIVTSYEEGITKPSVEIFKILANKLNLSFDEILMCDDRAENVETLKNLGFVSFVYSRLEDFKTRLINLGVKF